MMMMIYDDDQDQDEDENNDQDDAGNRLEHVVGKLYCRDPA